MTQPFDKKDILYRFTPTEAETGLFDEYAAVRMAGSVLFYARNRTSGEWIDSGYFAGLIIARLLTDNTRLAHLLSLHRRFHNTVACPEEEACYVCREEEPEHAK